MNRIISQIIRILTRKATNWGVNKGISQLSRKGSKGGASPNPNAAKQTKTAREMTKRARQAARITRRFR